MKASDWFTKLVTVIKIPSLLAIVVFAAFVLGTILRLVVVHRYLPLSLDEAWTGAIVAQPTLRATIDQSLFEPNAPSYFIFMYFWTKWFGLSDSALRLPSFVFGAIAPLITLLPSKGMERSARLVWCGLVALWIPGIWYSQEARNYSLAFFLATACTVAYVRLLTQPSMQAAIGWALLGCLTILTQYHSLLLVGCQGIGYLVVHRQRALRTWPAALLFLPAVAWMVAHIPRVLQYADPKASIYPLVKLGSLLEVIYFLVGDVRLAILLLIAALALGVLAWQSTSPPRRAKFPDATSVWVAAGTAAVGALVLISIGTLRPTFAVRYLIAFTPGILLGFSLLAARFGQRWELVPVGIVILFGIFACAENARISQIDGKSVWNFEQASHELEKYGVDQVVFLLDSPVTKILQPSQLKALGGFYFKRDGLTIHITPIFLQPGDNPNESLLAAATTSRSGILWLYEPQFSNTAAVSVQIEQIDRAWVCNNFVREPLGVVACHRK